MPNGYLEKIEISKRVFYVFVKMKTQDYTGEPKKVGRFLANGTEILYLCKRKRKEAEINYSLN
jgi:hypothetical protein